MAVTPAAYRRLVLVLAGVVAIVGFVGLAVASVLLLAVLGTVLSAPLWVDSNAVKKEIAALVCWLASEECSFTTGAVFDVSGGRATY